MQLNNDIINELAKEFKIPLINKSMCLWFLRTQAGIFYTDFYENNYIALGWDLVSIELINSIKDDKRKKEIISDLYPKEQRPGLILSQMEIFYQKMQKGDLIVIPSLRGQRIAVGILDDVIYDDINHKYIIDVEYQRCKFKHKRAVKWLKQIDLWSDIYLFKVLRAQQTISNITKHAELVYRNLHPCYITNDGFHLTLHKTTEANYRVKDNIDLQDSVLQINSALSACYEIADTSDKILVKTAVGSPGFIEIILPYIPIPIMTGIFIFRGIVGKSKNSDDGVNTGIMAILSKINSLLNDQTHRNKTNAEIKQIEASTSKTQAEASLIEAQTRKINAEAEAIEIANQKEQKAIESIAESTRVMKSAITQSGIVFDKELDEVG